MKDVITVDILGRDIEINEIPFSILKIFAKRLISKTDNGVYDELINFAFKGSLNYREKVILLLNLRGLILGNNVSFQHKDGSYSFDISNLIDSYNRPYKPFNLYHNGHTYTFNYGTGLDLKTNKFDFIADCLERVDGKFIHGDLSDKSDILPACNFIKLYDDIFNELYDHTYNIQLLDIDIHMTNVLDFIGRVISIDLYDMYEMEYNLRNYLNFNADDLNTVSLPECKILLNHYISDQKKREQSSNQMLKED